MKILVFGGSIFVSWYIVKRLSEEGNEVITLNRGSRKGIHGNKVKEVYADRHDFEELNKALADVDFDYVIDVSAYTEEDIKLSYEAVKGRKIRGYIFISSSAVYKESEILPIKESFDTGWNLYWGNYGINKLKAEEFLQFKFEENGFPFIIVRPPYLYGEGNDIYREGFIFDRLREGKPIIIPYQGKTLMHFMHIEDLYRTIEKIIEKEIKGEIFNVGNSEGLTLKGWVNQCIEVYGKEVEVLNFEYIRYGYHCRDFFPFYDYQYYLATEKVNQIYKPQITMQEGLMRALKWYLSNEDKVTKRSHYSENCDKIAEILKGEL